MKTLKQIMEQATALKANKQPNTPYPQFVKGQKVKDNYGHPHTVDLQNGPQVFVDGDPNKWYHPTKIHAIKEEELAEVIKDGTAEINNKLEIVRQRVMDQLELITEICESYRLIKHPNYGHVGNLHKVEKDLDEIARFLRKPIKESVMTESVKQLVGYEFNMATPSKENAFHEFMRHGGIFSREINQPDDFDTQQSRLWVHLDRKGHYSYAFFERKDGHVLATDYTGGATFESHSKITIDQVAAELIKQTGVKGKQFKISAGHTHLYTLGESVDLNEGSNPMRDWIIQKLEHTEEPHDQILAEFKKKFGADKVKEFDRIVSEIVD